MRTKFNELSCTLFAAILICLESSFWSMSSTVTFSDSFQKAFKLYTESSIRDKVETSFKLLDNSPPQHFGFGTIRAFESSLLEILLEHRLPHPDRSHTQSTH